MTFFPSLLLIAISNATSFFRLPNFFNTAITVNLTVMLTVTTLLISVVNKLALTSYVKLMEGWLIFAQLVPFIQVFSDHNITYKSTCSPHDPPLTQVILITCHEHWREEETEHHIEQRVVNQSYMGCAVAPLEKLEKVELAHIILQFVTGSAESKDSPKNW